MTMLRNFDTDLDTHGVSRRVVDATPIITESATAIPRPTRSVEHLLTDEAEWGWQALRDYVVTEIEKRFGQQPTDARKEASIFKSFLDRWGSKAPAIARYAFEGTPNGWWHSAPISVYRFCKNSDPYFSVPIAEALFAGPGN